MRLHNNKEYLFIFLFITAITLFHLFIHLLYGDIPQIIKYFVEPSTNTALDNMYLYENHMPLSYIFRNTVLRYTIYPIFLFTFIIDRFNLQYILKYINWKTISVSILIISSIVIMVSNPYLNGLNRWPYYFLYQISFNNSSAAIYIYSLILWISIIIISFKYFDSKLLKNHTIWFTALIFLSIEEVWQYAVYIQSYFIQGNENIINMSSLEIVSLYLWRGIPTILLIYYIYKYRFNLKKTLFYFSLMLSIGASIYLILYPEFTIFSVFLRIVWAFTYILLAYSLNINTLNKDDEVFSK